MANYKGTLNKLPRSETTVTITIDIVLGKSLRLRLFLAKQFIKAACWLMNSGCEFEVVE